MIYHTFKIKLLYILKYAVLAVYHSHIKKKTKKTTITLTCLLI